MIDSAEENDTKKRPLVMVGVSITIVWLILAVCFALKAKKSFLELDLNAQGDFIAGVFSALAFLWLFIATRLQKDELEEQRRVAAQQMNEMIQQRSIFEKQADLLRSQTQIQHESLQIEMELRKINLKDRHYSWANTFIKKGISEITVEAISFSEGRIVINYFSDQNDGSEHAICTVDDNDRVHATKGYKTTGNNFVAVIECKIPAKIYFLCKSKLGIYTFGFRYATEACPCILEAAHLISPIDVPTEVINAAGFYTLKPIKAEHNDFCD